MAPLIVLVVAALLLRLGGAAGTKALASWRDAVRIAAVWWSTVAPQRAIARRSPFAAWNSRRPSPPDSD